MADLNRDSEFGERTECSRLGLRVAGQHVRRLGTPAKWTIVWATITDWPGEKERLDLVNVIMTYI